MAYTRNKFVLALIDELAEDGRRAIMDAYNGRGYKNRLFNLHDSYGSAVYVNGILYRYTIRYVGPEKTKGRINTGIVYQGERSFPNRKGERLLQGDEIEIDGRDEVERFFRDYKPTTGKGIELVIVAAMFYASILENGTLGTKYRVLSGATSAMRKYVKKYGGTLYKLNVYRNLDTYGSGSFKISRSKNEIKA